MASAVATSSSIAALVRVRARQAQSEHRALVVDDGSSLTLGGWLDRAERIARGLVRSGVRPDDRIALVVGDDAWIEYAIGNLAVYLAGATAVGLTERLGEDAIDRCLAQCEVTAVLHSCDVAAHERGRWWRIGDLEAADPPGVELPDPDAVHPDSVAEIVYTSGTTGEPKRVAVTHANLTFGRDTSGELFGGIESILCAVPPGTNAGHSALVVGLTTGSRAQVLRRVDADSIGAAIEQDAIEHAILPPDAAAELLRSGAHRRYDLSSVRALMFGSSAVPDAIVSALSEALPTASIMIGYGSTESAPAFARRSEPAWQEHGDAALYRRVGLESLGSAGGGTEVRIVDIDGRPVPAGTVGEIALRSEAPRRYYLDADPSTDGVFDDDGWVRMGDLGRLDADGTLRFIDRVPDAIVTGGHRVSSTMVENALMWHPAVRMAAVFAVPDAGDGQRVIAAVQADPGTESADLAHFLGGELDPADRPSQILLLEELPRGVTGKVLKSQLRRRYAPAAGVHAGRVD